MNKELFGPALRQNTLMAALALLIVGSALLLLLNQPAEAQANTKATSNLSLSSTSPGELVITWDVPSDAPDDYRVTWKKSDAKWPSYKNENTADGGNAFPTERSHTVTGLEEGTGYSARVRARYDDGNVKQSGPWTATQEITVASTPLPAKPAGLLTGASHDSVLLSWNNPGDDSITGYQVLRGPDAANLAVLEGDTSSASTSYIDSTVSAETTYVYAIRARNAHGLSPQSDPVTVTTLAAPQEEEEPETDQQIAGVDFTLDGKALDTTGTCSETDVASISDGCTVNIIIKEPVFAVVGTVDSDDRLSIKTGRDKTAVDGASTSADESDLRGADQTVILTLPEGRSLMRLWGDEDEASGDSEEHFYRVNVLPSWTLDGQTLPTHPDCRQDKDASNPDYSSANCSVQTGKTGPDFQFVNTLHDHYNVYVYVNGSTAINQPGSSNIGDAVALSLNQGVNRVKVRLATKSHDHIPENYRDQAFYYRVNVGLTAEIEAVKSPVIEGEEEVQFRITLSSTAPAGGVNVMVEITRASTTSTIGHIAIADFKVHTINIAQGQTEAILEIITTRDDIASNDSPIYAEMLQGTGYVIGTDSQATVQVNDPDRVNVEFADGCGQTITVGEGDGEISFDIVLDNPVAYNFTLVITLIHGLADAGNDYTGGLQILRFDHLQTRATATVPILDDTQLEPTESFRIWILRNGLVSNILTPTCGQSNPHLTIEITDNDTANIVLDAPEEVTEGDPIRLGLGPRPNVNCQVPFDFETTLTITGDTAQLQDSPATSETLELNVCQDPDKIKIQNDDSTKSDPIWQTIDQPGQQGERTVTFTIGTLTSSDSRVSRLIPERRSATVTIKDKPNSKATGDHIITGDAIVGEALTVDTSAISDSDGLINARFTYEWSKGLGTTKEELSTESSYTVREDDIGDRIRLTVSFTDDEGFQEELTAVPTYAVLPYLEHYFGITEKSIGEPLSGTRDIGTWVYLSDWPMVRSADGTSIHHWGVNPIVTFTIPHTVTYEDGAKATWIRVEDVTFTATQSGSTTGYQGRSELVVTIKQISKKVDKRQVPYGEDLGKIIITLDDGVDLPDGPKLNVREGSDTLTIRIVSNGK